ncbi:hypothetical protein ACNUDM_17380 [Vibrio chaetopteri]|uniref:hypothetical protein n=1 Tax=Vibrio chaetopteri TaxID=3016528 RepID=UPI003AB54ECA
MEEATNPLLKMSLKTFGLLLYLVLGASFVATIMATRSHVDKIEHSISHEFSQQSSAHQAFADSYLLCVKDFSTRIDKDCVGIAIAVMQQPTATEQVVNDFYQQVIPPPKGFDLFFGLLMDPGALIAILTNQGVKL